MKKEPSNVNDLSDSGRKSSSRLRNQFYDIDRRKFIKTAATGALALTIVPRHVLGGPNYVAPSDKLTLAYVAAERRV